MKPTVEKVFPSGALRVSSIVNGALMTRTYYGYTRREAVRLFKAEAKTVAATGAP